MKEVMAFLVLVALLDLQVIHYFDSDTTIATNGWVVAVIWGVAAGPTVGMLLRHWFGRRENLHEIPSWHLKRDSPGRWVLAGVAIALGWSALLAFTVFTDVRVATQHLSGRRVQVVATVNSIRQLHRGKRVCNQRASFVTADQDAISACIDPVGGPRLADQTIRVGDRVRLVLVESTMGTALVGVVPGS
jgi:hypothetical protein